MTRTTTHFDKAPEIHISEGEALRDFARLLGLVRSGARIIIDGESSNLPVAVISPPRTSITSPVPPSRKISEVIALLPENAPAVMDADFARDVEAAIASHREPLKSAWD
jgi:hypothetical protein